MINDKLKNLKEINEIFLLNDNKCWLTAGTLLGFCRDGNFIKNDYDIDIGTEFKFFNKKIIKDLLKNDWFIRRIGGYVNDSLIFGLLKRNIKLDLVFFYKRNKKQVYHSVGKFENSKEIRCDYVYSNFGLKKSKFLGNEFFIPDDEINFLKEHYGDNWKIPISKWNYITDPCNIIDTGIVIDKLKQKEELKKWMAN